MSERSEHERLEETRHKLTGFIVGNIVGFFVGLSDGEIVGLSDLHMIIKKVERRLSGGSIFVRTATRKLRSHGPNERKSGI